MRRRGGWVSATRPPRRVVAKMPGLRSCSAETVTKGGAPISGQSRGRAAAIVQSRRAPPTAGIGPGDSLRLRCRRREQQKVAHGLRRRTGSRIASWASERVKALSTVTLARERSAQRSVASGGAALGPAFRPQRPLARTASRLRHRQRRRRHHRRDDDDSLPRGAGKGSMRLSTPTRARSTRIWAGALSGGSGGGEHRRGVAALGGSAAFIGPVARTIGHIYRQTPQRRCRVRNSASRHRVAPAGDCAVTTDCQSHDEHVPRAARTFPPKRSSQQIDDAAILYL